MKQISTHILDLMLRQAGTRRADSAGAAGGLGQLADTELGAYRPGRPLRSVVARRTKCRQACTDWLSTPRVIFVAQKISALYPVVDVTFQVRDGESQFHIPLLLSANGYTTYRGTDHDLLKRGARVRSSIREWLNLSVRWFHVFAGIMWVGQTYYFTWLDGQFRKLEKEAPRTGPSLPCGWSTAEGFTPSKSRNRCRSRPSRCTGSAGKP